MAATLDLGNLLVHLRLNSAQYNQVLRSAGKSMKVFSRGITKLGRQIAVKVVLPLTLISGASIKAFASFDDAMTKSLAIMGKITPKLREEMEDLALSISGQGVSSATDLAKAYFFLASAGLDAKQSMASLMAVERFAVAGAFDLATATDLATDAQSALGLTVKDAQKNLVNMTRVTDTLIGANTLANATAEQFSLALTSGAAPAMKAFGIELEEGVAVLAAFADQGIKAQNAGNLFSRLLRLMTKGFIANRQAWKSFGINIFTATGALKSMDIIIGDVSNALEGLSTEQKIISLEMLGFKARSQQAILPLLGLQDSIKKYNEQLIAMKGITKEVAEKQLKSFSSQMKILWNNVKNTGIAIGARLAPSLERLGLILRQNQPMIENFAIAFADRIIFLKDVLVNFIIFMRTDWKTGIKIALDIALELFIGFSKAVVVVMKSAAISASNAFIQVFGSSLGKWLVDISKPSGILGKIANLSPLIAAGRIAILNSGIGLIKASARDSLETDLKGDLKNVVDEVIANLKRIDEAAKNITGLDFITKPLEELKAKDFEREAKFMWENLKNAAQPYLDTLIKLKKEFIDMFRVTSEGLKATDDSTKKVNKTLEDLKIFMKDVRSAMNDWGLNAADIATNVGERMANAFDSMSSSLADFVTTGKADFHSLAVSILKDLLAIMIRARLVLPLATALGFFSGPAAKSSGTPSGPITAANGGILPGHFQAFAAGGVVNKPTLGLIGEGGQSEAIVPLPNGRSIPVQIRGGMTPPTVIINNNTDKRFEQDGAPKFNGREWVIGVVTEEITKFGPLRHTIQGIGQNG